MAYVCISTIVFSFFVLTSCAPKPEDDMDEDNEDVLPKLINQSLDYNVMVGHFKDFFMYLPVMFTTLRETMTGFPKFAEGIKMLTSGSPSSDDCKCKPKSGQNANTISKSSGDFN